MHNFPANTTVYYLKHQIFPQEGRNIYEKTFNGEYSFLYDKWLQLKKTIEPERRKYIAEKWNTIKEVFDPKEAFQTNKEFNEEFFKQSELARFRKYKQDNKEKIREKAKQKVKCECGKEISRHQLPTHRKTKYHIKWFESNQ